MPQGFGLQHSTAQHNRWHGAGAKVCSKGSGCSTAQAYLQAFHGWRWQCSCMGVALALLCGLRRISPYYSITAPIIDIRRCISASPRHFSSGWAGGLATSETAPSQGSSPVRSTFFFFSLFVLSRPPVRAFGGQPGHLAHRLVKCVSFCCFSRWLAVCWLGPGACACGAWRLCRRRFRVRTPRTGRRPKKMRRGRRREEEERGKKQEGKWKKKGKKGKKGKKLQHPDFARGHPPHYYLGQNVLNFADRTGCGALTIVWP